MIPSTLNSRRKTLKIIKKYSKTSKVSYVLGGNSNSGHFGYDMTNIQMALENRQLITSIHMPRYGQRSP